MILHSKCVCGAGDLRFRNATSQAWERPTTFPPQATATPGFSWRQETPSLFRAAEGFKDVRISSQPRNIENVVTMMSDATHQSGYYPTCSDLIEVTAQVATLNTSATDEAEIVADENLCGPFAIRWYLDPKPGVRVTSTRILPDGSNIAPFALTLGVAANVSPMMGNVDAATFQWEREIWRYNTITNQYTIPTPGTMDAWTNITLTDPITITSGSTTRSGGSYSVENLGNGDKLFVRCHMNLSAVPATNTRLDRACAVMAAEPIQVVMKLSNGELPKSSSPVGNGDDIVLAAARSSDDDQVNTRTTPASSVRAPYTVDLLTAPNPADAQVGLRFSLRTDARVTIEIIDALQRVVLVPMKDQPLTQGAQDLSIPVGTLPSGTYSVRVRVLYADGAQAIQQRIITVAR